MPSCTADSLTAACTSSVMRTNRRWRVVNVRYIVCERMWQRVLSVGEGVPSPTRESPIHLEGEELQMEADGTAATQKGPPPRLRPLSLGEILDVAIKLCVAHSATLLKAIVFVIVPVQVLATIIMVSTGSADYDVFGSAPEDRTDRETNTYLAGQLGAVALQTIAVALATAVCFRAFARAYLGQTGDWRESLRFAIKRIPQMLWLGLLYMLAFIAGLALLALPAALAGTTAAIVVAVLIFFVLFVWIYISWSFALPALFVEDVRGVKALQRSFDLVKKRWWPTFGTVTVGYILASIVSGVAQAVFALVIVAGVDSSSVLAVVIISLAGLVGYALTTPFQAALLLVIYFDLRVRKEGFDLELLAEQFGDGETVQSPWAPAPAAAPAVLEGDSVDTPYWPAPSSLRDPDDDGGLAARPPDLGPPPPGWAPPGAPRPRGDER